MKINSDKEYIKQLENIILQQKNELLEQIKYLKKLEKNNEILKRENEELNIKLRKKNLEYNNLLEKYEKLSSKHKILKALPFVSKSEKSKFILDEAESEIKKAKSRKGEIHKKKFQDYDFEKHVSKTIIMKPDEKVCPKCGEKLIKFSEDISYLVETKMPEIIVTKVIKENFKCPKCNKENNKIYYPLVNTPFPNSILTSSFASFIAFNKYELGIPFEHLASYIKEQIGFPISKQCLGNYMERLSERLLPIYEKMKTDLLSNEAKVIHADETTLVINAKPRDEKDRKKSYVFLYSSSFYGNQINVYDFKASRESKHLKDFFKDFSGVIVCDDYPGYDSLKKEYKNIKLQRCWVHVRRRFANIVKTIDSKNLTNSKAAEVLNLIKILFDKEKEIQKKARSYDEIKKLRRKDEKPIINKIFKLIYTTRSKQGSALDEAFNYFKKVSLDLLTFLNNPCVDLTNNIAERAIKPFVLQRKIFMTSKSYDGAQIMAILFSIVRTAKINLLDIYDYLTYVCDNIDKISIDNLLPYSKNIKEKFSLNKE